MIELARRLVDRFGKLAEAEPLSLLDHMTSADEVKTIPRLTLARRFSMDPEAAEVRDPAIISLWAESLLHEAEDVLARMDTALTLAEAKIAIMRRMRARRESLHGTS